MEKLVYLLWKQPETSIEAIRDGLLGLHAPRLLALTRGDLTILVADAGEHLRSPHEPQLGAAVSLWLDSVDQRGRIEAILRQVAPELAGYLVTESVPRDYAERGWPDGETSPGITMLALIRKPPRLTYDEFIGHWHGSHTPLSLEIHPLTRYIRNVVARPLTSGAPDYQGIVPEGFASLEHFFDPRLLYGSKEKQRIMVDDMGKFLDVDQVHWTIVSEHILRS